MSEETALPSRQNIEKHLAALSVFESGPVYSSFKATIARDIKATEESILHSPPVSVEDLVRLIGLYAKREQLQANLSIFEEHRTGLEGLLSTIDSKSQPTVR